MARSLDAVGPPDDHPRDHACPHPGIPAVPRRISGTATDIEGTLRSAAVPGVRPETEGCERMFANKARFRIVLTAGREPPTPVAQHKEEVRV
jgi:hypothetical protein